MPRNPVTDESEVEETAGVAAAPVAVEPDFDYTPVAGPVPDTGEVVGDEEVASVPLSALELILDEKADADDVWGYIDEIEIREVPLSARQNFYPRFIAMVATREPSERDALVARAVHVFRVRAETARRGIDELVQSDVSQTKSAPAIITEDFIAEMVHCPGNNGPSVRFLVYKPDGTQELQDHVTVGDTNYVVPLIGTLVDAGALLLPSATETYGTEAELREDIRKFIRRYVRLERDIDLDLAAYYVHYTWAADRIPIAPYLHAVGDFESGKSRLLDVIGQLVRGGLFMAGSLTAAVLYRALDLARATLIVDEADFDAKHSEQWGDILKVLLVGSQRGRPVLRTDMDAKGAIRAFDPFGPKVLATRTPFYDAALASRCLDFVMYPGEVGEDIPFILPDREWRPPSLAEDEPNHISFYDHARQLRNKLLMWRVQNIRNVTYSPIARYEGLTPRITQAAIALLSTSEDTVLRDQVLGRLRQKSLEVKQQRRESPEGLIAGSLIKRWLAKNKPTFVSLQEVTAQAAMDMDDDDVRSQWIAAKLRTLGFTVETKGAQGYTQVFTQPQKITSTAARYGISFEEIARMPVAPLVLSESKKSAALPDTKKPAQLPPATKKKKRQAVK